MKVLLKTKNCDLSIRISDSRTALDKARILNYKECIKLLEAAAVINVTDE